MIDFNDIVARVAALKEEFPSMDPREIISARGISLLELPMGTSPNAIKGFIQKNNRCCSIVVNADLSNLLIQKILFHELGHYEEKHLNFIRSGILSDKDLSYRRDRTQTARFENEANFYAAECTLDTMETLSAIYEYDLLTAARILHVPVELLDYKLRLLHHTGQLENYVDVFGVQSNCLLKIGDVSYED
jgi:Zn-dependent peptidase ImmA (M78 family)